MGGKRMWQWIGLCILCSVFWSCGTRDSQIRKTPPQSPVFRAEEKKAPPPVTDWGLTERLVTEEELLSQQEIDPDLNLTACWEILSRLNIKGHFHISDDMKMGKPLKVPNDFRAFKNWSPLPPVIAAVSGIPKFILITKDIPFMGWYENGKLKGDTYISVGKKWDWTEPGLYKVLNKEPDYYSKSYPNEFGRPAWMPWSMRIYGGVFIHGGDIPGGYCSRGCIYVPMGLAEDFYRWTDLGTAVLVLDALGDLDRAVADRSRLHAQRSK